MEEAGGGGVPEGVTPPEVAVPGPATIRDKAEALWSLLGVITGNAGDIRAAFSGMAVQFSDLVRDDISSEGDYDEQKWEQASLALAFGAEIAHQWADDVEEYDENRSALLEEVTTHISTSRILAPGVYRSETFQSPYVGQGYFGPEAVQEGPPVSGGNGSRADTYGPEGAFTGEFLAWREERIRVIIQDYESRARTLQEGLVEAGEDRIRGLDLGPGDDVTVRQLVDAGYLGWSVFNIIGPEGDPPLPVSEEMGSAMATELNEYIYGDREPDARFAEILTTLAAVSAKAVALQALDDEMDRDTDYHLIPSRFDQNNMRDVEIDFLSTLLGDLDEHVGESSDNVLGDGGLAYLPYFLDRTYDEYLENPLERDQLDQVLGALGDAMLIVSNEELGGGYDRLPESVRTLADGDAIYTVNRNASHAPDENSWGWMEAAGFLAQYLGNADPELRGGSEFSANLITSMGHHLNGIDNDIQDYDEGLTPLLEVATRNEDASYAVLTDRHEHPTFDQNANALKGLFTHDWTDDGEALSGLVGWIPEASESDDSFARQRAQEAALGVIQVLTEDGERIEAFQDTGVSATKANGEVVNGAAFTLLNPTLAAGLTDVAATYLFDLSAPGPTDGHMDGSPVYEIFSNPDVADRDLLQVDLQSRQQFFSLLMGDDASATYLYTTLNHLEGAGLHPLMGEDGALESAGNQRGTLRGLLDSALQLEYLHRTGQDLDEQNDTEMRDRIFGDLRTTAFALTGFAKHPALIAGSFIAAGAGLHEYDLQMHQDDISPNYQTISEIGITDPNSPFAPTEFGRTLQAENVEYKTQLEMLDWLVRNDDLSIEDVSAMDERLVASDGESVIDYAEFGRYERDLDGRSDTTTVVRNLGLLLDELESTHPVLGELDTAYNEAGSFTDAYVTAYEEVFRRTFPDITLDEAEEYWQSRK